MIEEPQIWKAMEGVMDPEIDLNVVDLGLIYDVSLKNDNQVHISMTLTVRGCPMSQTITRDIEKAVLEVAGVKAVTVEVVWDPPWNPRMISLEGQKKLGRNSGAVKAWEKY